MRSTKRLLFLRARYILFVIREITMLECVLFDLDRTLLYMDQIAFTKAYLGEIGEFMTRYGYEPSRLAKTIMSCTYEMIANDGSNTNYTVFWSAFARAYGESALGDKSRFDKFYVKRFDSLSDSCGKITGAVESVQKIRAMGLKLVLASNPVFPRIAMEKRAQWAGLDVGMFDYVTSYENSRYCKPNPMYYTEIAKAVGVLPENCLMVGNDVREDIIAAKSAGLNVFLLPEFILNSTDADITEYPRGSFNELLEYIGAIK